MSEYKDLLRRVSAWYFDKRMLPHWAIVAADTFIVFACCLLTFWISFKTQVLLDNIVNVIFTSLFYSAISWVGVLVFKTYSGVLRYSSFVDLMKLTYANLLNLGIALVLTQTLRWYHHFTIVASLPAVHTCIVFLLATLVMWGLRVMVKFIFDSVNADKMAGRALIYGSLNGAIGLAKNVRSQTPPQFDIRGFITHEQRIKDMKVLGVYVYSTEDDFEDIIRREDIQALLVSPQSVNEFRNNQKIQDVFIGNGVKIFMGHEATEASVKDGALMADSAPLREVSVEDLLPRSEIRVDMRSVGAQLSGKRILITGSAGSIGSEIVRQVAQFGPEKMMLIDQAETPQHDIRLMMARDFPEVPCEVMVASISRQTRMEHVFSEFKPDYVFHAAAYKHVPMMEDNPSEAVLNNIYGTKIIADLSVKYGARKFVMISTDKAVNPTNVMGCSKRICEIYVQSLDRKLKMEALQASHGRTADYTQFVTTRFGNVLGSNGSVIPIFRRQIQSGGPVTVTDERIVRYFMLIPEACKLVLEAGTKGNGGEILVFDMGKPVKIADLAKRMIALSRADVQIKYTGLRDGEKLYEEVLNELEDTKPTFHEKIRIANVREYDYDEVNREIEELFEIARKYDNMETVRKMKAIVPEYKSNNSVYESLDTEQKK